MSHAWLDSLDEDWISQPSSSPPQLPPLRRDPIPTPKSQDRASKIPRRAHGSKSSWTSTAGNSTNILSERSANGTNRSRYRAAPRKLSQGEKPDRHDGSTRSSDSDDSVLHSTMQRNPSPSKSQHETPEWKRRLIYGDVAYGEQRDLFCSAATGLQDMFKPPEAQQSGQNEDQSAIYETTMPSSPPGYPQPIPSDQIEPDPEDLQHLAGLEDEEDGQIYPNDVTPSPSPRKSQRGVQYRLNVDDSFDSHNGNGLGDFPNSTPSRQPEADNSYKSSLLSVNSEANNLRKISGQTDIRNERLSPILIGRHSGEDGEVDFAPIEVPAEQLTQKLERLRISQLLLDTDVDSYRGFDTTVEEESSPSDDSDLSGQHGRYSNMQGSGRSGEGSFRIRGLSPGFNGNTSEMLPDESLQASTPKQFPSIKNQSMNPYETEYFSKSPALPKAPFPSPEKRQTKAAHLAPPSGGSPLKLFGPYDTFTNQTLLRRISQFEEEMSGSTSSRSRQSSMFRERPLTGVNQTSLAGSSPHKLPHIALSSPTSSDDGSINYFGAKDLDDYSFEAEGSSFWNHISTLEENKNYSPNAGLFDDSPSNGIFSDEDSDLFVRRRRTRSSASNSSKRGRPQTASSQFKTGFSDYEGKRGRSSPSKDPTPKRRRTLHRSDIAFGREAQLASCGSPRQRLQSNEKPKLIGPPEFQRASASILAMRSIIRPRTPTSSHKSSENPDESSIGGFDQELPEIRYRISSSNARAPSECSDGDRKPSIRTQDFVDQAAQIMAMIRSQVKPPGLSSVEESETENVSQDPDVFEDSYDEDSTTEPLSRPPSREGKAMPRAPQQDNQEVLDRLKKYQELSDIGDALASIQSKRVSSETSQQSQPEPQTQTQTQRSASKSDVDYSNDYEVSCNPAKVRFTANPAVDSWSAGPGRDQKSQSSSASSSTKSFPTISSRGSECRKTIMPESVSHLIPDRVGSMYLDKQKNLWVKQKEAQEAISSSSSVHSEESEEDPFASIPDLSVDLTKEMQNLRLATSPTTDGAASPSVVGSPANPLTLLRGANRGYVTLSPDAKLSPNVASLAREEFHKLDAKVLEDLSAAHDEVDGDGSLHGDDPTGSPKRRRNITISFSSPIASVIQDVVIAEDLDILEDDPSLHTDSDTVDISPNPPSQLSTNKPVLKAGTQSPLYSSRPSSRHAAFIPRPVSRIDEQDEDSTIEIQAQEQEQQRQISIIGETSLVSHRTADDRHASLSFLVNNTPGHSMLLQPDDSAVINQNIGKLSLSPLSEFTMNNTGDQSYGFEVSYILGKRHLMTGDGSKQVMSMTIRELVDKLSEVEPHELYWEDLEELDLHEKRLSSLHMLNEFCGKLVTLDASQNSLSHLDGIPAGVRQLKVSHNMLTELTSWDHLMNLQYVDVSGNEVKSLSALKNLVHLRSIKADNNQLTSLDGLASHDGLLSLRARDNQIEDLDFASVRMERLTELDLEGNKIMSVHNLELLPALGSLKLGKNKLTAFTVKACVKKLRQLDISDNDLTYIDITNLPHLQTLHADRNSIYELGGFKGARRLDSLSLREQRGNRPLSLSFLSSAYEVRKLFLSGNYLESFDPTVDFLNLQLLELANCGLQSLPENLGQLMPNLRSMNLNFNAISDLSPLRFIPRLKKLLVAGNRLADSTSVTELLTEFPHLTQLDLRDNPVTLGFYMPLQVLVPVDKKGFVDPFVLPDADAERDKTFANRIDEPTKLRRRLHQIVFAASCKRLRNIDGLALDRKKVLARDSLYMTLVVEGLLPDETCVEFRTEESQRYANEEGGETTAQGDTSKTNRTYRWEAEQNFA